MSLEYVCGECRKCFVRKDIVHLGRKYICKGCYDKSKRSSDGARATETE